MLTFMKKVMGQSIYTQHMAKTWSIYFTNLFPDVFTHN